MGGGNIMLYTNVLNGKQEQNLNIVFIPKELLSRRCAVLNGGPQAKSQRSDDFFASGTSDSMPSQPMLKYICALS